MKLVKCVYKLFAILAKRFALGVWYPHVYAKAAKAPIVPGKTVFVEVREEKLSDSFKLLFAQLFYNYSMDVHVDFLMQASSRFDLYHKHCVATLRDIATAEYIFLNDASDVISCVDLRGESRIIQTWHACGAFKKWGMSTAELKFGGTRKQKERHPYYSNLSLVTTSSPEIGWAYIEAMHLEDRPQIVKALGVSRTDLFFQPEFLQASLDEVHATVPQARGKKIILYAPTFRGRVAEAQGPDQLDIQAMASEFADRYVLLIKHHPFVKNPPAIPQGCEEFAFNVGGSLAIDVLLASADLCISDYSSIVFEYSLLERPMAFFAYDKSDYDDWRGFYYDFDQLTPGPVCTTTQQLIDWVKQSEAAFDPSEVVAFREKFMSACDGRATQRILDEVYGDALQRFAV